MGLEIGRRQLAQIGIVIDNQNRGRLGPAHNLHLQQE
jgi:hypothetical protein